MAFTVPYAAQQIYQPNGRLVDLIRAQGADSARAAELRGQQQAQLWGGVGQAIQGTVGSVLQAQAQAPKIAIEQAQATRLAGENADTAALRGGQSKVDAMMAGDQLPTDAAGPRQDSYLDSNGLFDVKKMNAALASSGSGHLAPELLKGAEAINDSITKHQALEQQAGQLKTTMIGDMADGALKLSKLGMPIPAAMDFVVQPALATKRIQPQEYAQLRSQVSQLPPEQQAAALTTLMDAAAKLDKGDTLAKDAVHIDRYGRTESSNVVAEPNKGDYTGPDGIRYHADGQPVTGQQMRPQIQPPSSTSQMMRLVSADGKTTQDVPISVVPTKDGTGSTYHYLGQDVSGRVRAIPSAAIIIHNESKNAPALPAWAMDDTRPSGADANKLDPVTRMTPNGLYQDAMNFIASGQYPPTGRGSDIVSQAKRAAIDSKVGAIAATSGMDVPALRAFYKSNADSLKQQQKAYDAASVSISKADRDVDMLEKVLPKIGDTGSPLFNKPLRSFEKDVAGNEDMSEFITRLRSVQNEYTRILNASMTGGGGGVMSDSARHETEQLIDGKATIAQMLRSIAALKSEGGNRLLSQGEQIQRIQKRMTIAPSNSAPKSDPLGVFGRQ